MLKLYFIIADDQKTAERKLLDLKAENKTGLSYYFSSEKKSHIRIVSQHLIFGQSLNETAQSSDSSWSAPTTTRTRVYSTRETYIALLIAEGRNALDLISSALPREDDYSSDKTGHKLWKNDSFLKLAYKALKHNFRFNSDRRLVSNRCLSKVDVTETEEIEVCDLREHTRELSDKHGHVETAEQHIARPCMIRVILSSIKDYRHAATN